MIYPLNKICPTEPRIDVRNITLRNVHSKGGYLVGIIRCNETNPCTGINFENVTHDGFFSDFKNGFITENAYGTVVNSYPDPHINRNSTEEEINSISEVYKEYLKSFESYEVY